MSQLPEDTSVEAEYADGYVLSETEHHDVSPYDPHFNVLRAIIDHAPEAAHGNLTRFSVYYRDHRYDIDWTTLPTNARPIRFRDGQLITNASTGEQIFDWVGCRFGYQYNDETGKNYQEVKEL